MQSSRQDASLRTEGQTWLLQQVSKGDEGGEGKYALRSAYGNYLRSTPEGTLRAEREIVGEFETWTGVKRRLRVFSFRSYYARFVRSFVRSIVFCPTCPFSRNQQAFGLTTRRAGAR